MTAMAFDGAGEPLKQVERTVAPPTRNHILLRVQWPGLDQKTAVRTLERLEQGKGTDADLETILDVGSNIIGRAFCALGDAVPVPITSAIQYFRDEIIQHQKDGGCPFDPAASTAWAV